MEWVSYLAHPMLSKMKKISPIKRLYNDYVPYDKRALVSCLKAKKFVSENKVLFIHVPKAAGSSVNLSLYGKNLGHFSIEQYLKMNNGRDGIDFSFSMVRNPYSRIYSAYKFSKQGGTKHVRMSKPWLYNSPDFNTFDRFVCEWLVKQDICNIDYIFRPQHTFLEIDNKLAVDFVGKVEDFKNAMDIVRLKTNLSFENTSVNVTSDVNEYVRFYSNETIDIITNLYKKDIEAFGYEFEN